MVKMMEGERDGRDEMRWFRISDSGGRKLGLSSRGGWQALGAHSIKDVNMDMCCPSTTSQKDSAVPSFDVHESMDIAVQSRRLQRQRQP
jgi:hypothetical protein